jgi:hypothetical protein
MDCVEELAKSPVAKISISRAEPDLRGPVGAPSGNDRSLRNGAVPVGVGNVRKARQTRSPS